MAHTVIPPPRGPTATLELAHKGNINDKTIPERDREVRDFIIDIEAEGRITGHGKYNGVRVMSFPSFPLNHSFSKLEYFLVFRSTHQ